jgi:hypothetical protein
VPPPVLMPPPAVMPPVVEVEVPAVNADVVVQAGEGVFIPGNDVMQNDDNAERDDDVNIAEFDNVSTLDDESVTQAPNDDDWQTVPTVRRSGRTTKRPNRLIEEISNCTIDGTMTDDGKPTDDSDDGKPTDDENYYSVLSEYCDIDDYADDDSATVPEYAMVGAGVGGGFVNTNELHVLNFNQAMKTNDRDEWMKAIEEEHQKMVDYNVWQVVQPGDVPPNSKILTSTWAMKKKANGKYRARINARGYEQVDGIHYDDTTKSAPVTNDITIRILFIGELPIKYSKFHFF